MTKYKEFEEELESLVAVAREALTAILLSEDRTSKHPPYTWREEDVNEHVLKAIGHTAYGTGQFHGYKKSDGEDHLHNAITRLVMAKWLIDYAAEKYCHADGMVGPCCVEYGSPGFCVFLNQGGSWETCGCGKRWGRVK